MTVTHTYMKHMSSVSIPEEALSMTTSHMPEQRTQICYGPRYYNPNFADYCPIIISSYI